MSDNPTDFQAGELLRAIGTVPVPEPRVLENAREVLWSAVASEMLGIDPAAEQTTATQELAGAHEQQHRTTRQRQPGQSQNEHKR